MTLKKSTNIQNNSQKNPFLVLHPLDDTPEQKIDISQVGRMRLTLGVRISLLVLCSYLILMAILILYHFLDLAGLFTKH